MRTSGDQHDRAPRNEVSGRMALPEQRAFDLDAGNPPLGRSHTPRLTNMAGTLTSIGASGARDGSRPQADTAELRKARGAFFTPQEVADFLTGWAIRTSDDLVLEPSCGEAAFLLSAGKRLGYLDGGSVLHHRIHGVELHSGSADRARFLLQESGLDVDIHVGDFFDFHTSARYDAIVGNPPYIRYQEFTGLPRLKAQKAALAHGVRLSALASSWAAFVIHAASLLKPKGRLALVIPAELLAVNYAREVRHFLLSRFGKVGLVTFSERIFPGVLEEVILLLAEGEGPTDRFEIYKAGNMGDLKKLEDLHCTWVPSDPYGKWTAALIEPAAAEVYGELTTSALTPLLTWGETSLGMVTGNNRYFTLSAQEVKELNLENSELLPISPPGSRHMRGLTLSPRIWDELALQNKRVYLFYPQTDSTSSAARRYIARGERCGVDQAYKCRVRSPWWRVPLVSVPDLFFTYMNHVTPRIVRNRARLHHLNSIHGVYLRKGLHRLGTDLLPLAALNTATLLGGEIVGRSYGGGILKLEPKEADLLPVPSIELLASASSALRTLQPKVVDLLGRGALLEVVELIDQVVLRSQIGLKTSQLDTLRKARRELFDRRQTRASK